MRIRRLADGQLFEGPDGPVPEGFAAADEAEERTPPTDKPGYGLRNAAADAVRIGSGFATSAPLLGSLVGAGAEYTAQKIEGKPTDYTQIGIAAAVPPALSTALRGGRAVGRMATRMMPSRFRGAHDAAIGSAEDLIRSLAPADDAGAMMNQAQRGAVESGAQLDTPATRELLEALRDQFGRVEPLSPEGTQVRELVKQLDSLRTGEPVPLANAEAVRRELRRARKSGPNEVKAIEGSLVRDIESAAEAGGVEARALRTSAEAYKRELGAQRLSELLEKAAPPRTGADGGRTLNVANLEKFVRTDKDLPRLLGDEGMAQVQAFIDRTRGLPPDQAVRFAPMLLGLLGAHGGLIAGSPKSAAASLLVGLTPEFLQNMFYVGRNPAGLNRAAGGLGQAGRVGLGAVLGR